jgi:hypothetical protein
MTRCPKMTRRPRTRPPTKGWRPPPCCSRICCCCRSRRPAQGIANRQRPAKLQGPFDPCETCLLLQNKKRRNYELRGSDEHLPSTASAPFADDANSIGSFAQTQPVGASATGPRLLSSARATALHARGGRRTVASRSAERVPRVGRTRVRARRGASLTSFMRTHGLS